ncbi:MAG: DUF5107 domain-containing protein [Chloroflexota bacterium]
MVRAEAALLQITVRPDGSTVLVNGEPRGATPLTLSLDPAQYEVRIENRGYQPLERTLSLSAGEQARLSGSLLDVAPPSLSLQLIPQQPRAGENLVIYLVAHDNVAVARIELWLDAVRVLEEVGTTAVYHWATSAASLGRHTITALAYDVVGNVTTVERELSVAAPVLVPTSTLRPTATAWPSPTPTPIPLPTATATVVSPTPDVGQVAESPVSIYYETTLAIPTYPYPAFLWQETDVRYGVPFWRLDRTAYEASRPVPVPQAYRALVIENEYLQLTFLPELGGRLYRCVYKPTDQNIFYQNPVIKPSHWGPLLPGEHNWWLAAGGMEWAMPVAEHGYAFGNAWDFAVEATSQGTTVTLWDSTANDRLRFEVQVTLPSRQAVFTVRPRLLNPLPGDTNVQLWINAMLTLGSATISPQTVFTLPSGPVVVHSTGDARLAVAGETMSWPIFDGRDLARYENWDQWLGVFVQPAEQNFVGAYNLATGLGVARIFPPEDAAGVKLFAFGSGFADRDHYTDGGSQYFELWGGANGTFWSADDVVVPAGGELTWIETWYPFSGLGGLTQATERAVLYLERQGNQLDLSIGVAESTDAQLQLFAGEGDGERLLWQQDISLAPGDVFRQQVTLAESLAVEETLTLRLLDRAGTLLLSHTVKK